MPRQINATRKTAADALLLASLILLPIGCASPLDRADDASWSPRDRLGQVPRAAGLARVTLDRQSATADDVALPDRAELADYIRHAMRHNPGLAASFYRWRAAIERVPQVRSLPDPQISFALVLDEVDRRTQYMGERYAISQMFPWFGKLDLRGDVAAAEAHVEAGRYEAQRLAVIEAVSAAYFEYAYLHRAAEISRENRELLAQIEAVARARYRAGSVTQADVVRAQIELEQIDDRIRSLDDMLNPARAALNAQLGRPSAASLPLPAAPPSEHAMPALPQLPDAHWLALAREHNASLAATRREAAQRSQAIALARREVLPDIMLGLEYGRDASGRMATMDGGGSDMVMGMVSINLPIWRHRNEATVGEAVARLAQTTHALQSEEHALDAALRRSLFDYRDSDRKLALYRGSLLPRARQAAATIEATYRVGDASFTDVMEAQRTLLTFALAVERAASDRAVALARLHNLVGMETLPDAVVPSPSDERTDP